jgi:hypothetical protein
VAQTIATSLQGRTDLLYREAPPAPEGTPAEAHVDSAPGGSLVPPESATDPDFFKPTPYDLEPAALSAAPLLDGYAEDWPRDPAAWTHFDQDGQHRFAVVTGVHERMLYVALEVHDEHPLFEAPGSNFLDPSTFGDRVWLGFEDREGVQQQVFLAATAPGAVSARRIESGEYGRRTARIEPRIRGVWRPTADGYRVEARVPLSMIGKGFGVLIDDRDARGGPAVSYGTLRTDDLHTVGHLILAAPELRSYLAQFLQPGLKLSVATPAGRVLARADALAQPAGLGPEAPILARLYRRFIDRPNEHLPLEAASPIYDRDRAVVIGRLEVAQSANRWIRLRDRALTHMLNFTLATSAIVVGAILAFAAWLALRLSRLRRASESALTRSGLVTTFPKPPRVMSSAMSPAASPPCYRASTSTPSTCARSPASSPTRSARRSRSCAPRSTTSNPSRCPQAPARTWSAPARAASGSTRSSSRWAPRRAWRRPSAPPSGWTSIWCRY